MTNQPHRPILDLMSDGQQRTSYEITDLLHGPQPDGKRWYAVSGACDAMVQSGHLVTCGKREHRTVYMISERQRLENAAALDTQTGSVIQ